MMKDLIPINLIPKVRGLGYRGCPTFYKVCQWFRKKRGYTSWVEQTQNDYIYKVYSNGCYRRPRGTELNYPHCKTYEQAEIRLIYELIKIAEED